MPSLTWRLLPTLPYLLFFILSHTPLRAEQVLQDDFEGPAGSLLEWTAQTGQRWLPQEATWNRHTLQIAPKFGQARSRGVGYFGPGPRQWSGNVVDLGKTLQSGTILFGVDLKHGLGVTESCASLESSDGVEGITLIWAGRRLKCGGNTWRGEIDMGIAEGNVRVEVALHLTAQPSQSTATLRYIQLDNPSNQGSVHLGQPQHSDRNQSGSFEFTRVALHVLKGGDTQFGFDRLSLEDNLQQVPELVAPPLARKYLFLDDRVIAQKTNAILQLGEVTKAKENPLFIEEHPWEARFDNLYPNVLYDPQESLYKIWYFTWTYDPATTDVPRDQRQPGTYMKIRESSDRGLKEGLGYATSQDGLHWKKPLMKVSPWKGEPSNLVAQPCHGAGILLDHRERDPQRRYKMLLKGQGMAARFSANGIHWGPYVSLPEIDAAGDTHNNALWSPELKRYVGFTRLWREGIRVVGRTESRDFIYWTKAVPVLSDQRETQPYSMPVIRYANLYLGFPAILRANEDRTHTELAWSPDTRTWYRIKRNTPLIPNAPTRGAYDWGTVYASFPIIRDNEIRIYYGGGNGQHLDWRDGSLCLATLRPDGFAGYESANPSRNCVLTTTPVIVAGNLTLSADTEAAGAITVSLLDEHGHQVLESIPLSGHLVNQQVTWKNDARFESWLGKKAQFRFEGKLAKLYAFEL